MERKRFCYYLSNFMILCSLVFIYWNVYSTVAVYHFILGLFGLRMINTINYILRDLVGFLALLYITFDYRGIIRKTHALDEKLYAVCAAVIICNYLLMTVASRVLMAAFGRIPEKFFFLGIGILCLTGYLIAGISISKALFDKEMKILSWIVAGVLIVVLLVMRDQYFIWGLFRRGQAFEIPHPNVCSRKSLTLFETRAILLVRLMFFRNPAHAGLPGSDIVYNAGEGKWIYLIL